MPTATATLPPRAAVPADDTWDLSRLFPSDAAWVAAFAEWDALIPGYERFRGTLGRSADDLAACLDFDTAFERLGDRVQTYASLKECEDTANGTYQAILRKWELQSAAISNPTINGATR